ncbi:MAG: hypothetical protein AAF669_02685 [Pseudomonadota bacterium]
MLEQNRITDPFPEIHSALLNSADIKRYVGATNMLSPFYAQDLKPSSYAVRMQGICKWWDETGAPQEINLDGGHHKRFKLKPNSIAFVELEPKLKLPEYIAIRFNLRIQNVYRGLLLGTGPLIDPGFEGKIYIPLHNLTTNEYTFSFNEELVWFEFTKTSPIPRNNQKSSYKKFPDDKKNMDLADYLDKATAGDPIISSIPDAMKKSSDMAEKAQKSARNLSWIGFATLVALVITTATLVNTTWDMQQNYLDKVQTLEIYIRDEINHIKNSNKEKDTSSSMITQDKVHLALSEKESLVRDISRIKDCINSIKDDKKSGVKGDACEM